MSRLTMVGISGAVALALISGAAELARGRDLASLAGNKTPITQALSFSSARVSAESTSSVNRGAKADRAAAPIGSAAVTRTVSLKLDGFSDTSFLVRIPVAAVNPTPPARPVMRRTMVACEPVVSVLTEVAKRLQPGRCVT